MVKKFPAQKGGRTVPSIALAVGTAHKCDTRFTMKARKPQYRQQDSSLVYTYCHGLPQQQDSLQEYVYK